MNQERLAQKKPIKATNQQNPAIQRKKTQRLWIFTKGYHKRNITSTRKMTNNKKHQSSTKRLRRVEKTKSKPTQKIRKKTKTKQNIRKIENQAKHKAQKKKNKTTKNTKRSKMPPPHLGLSLFEVRTFCYRLTGRGPPGGAGGVVLVFLGVDAWSMGGGVDFFKKSVSFLNNHQFSLWKVFFFCEGFGWCFGFFVISFVVLGFKVEAFRLSLYKLLQISLLVASQAPKFWSKAQFSLQKKSFGQEAFFPSTLITSVVPFLSELLPSKMGFPSFHIFWKFYKHMIFILQKDLRHTLCLSI